MKFVILSFSFIAGLAVLLLPYKIVDSNPVPAIIFNKNASVFHALVISIMVAFTASFAATMAPTNYGKIAGVSTHVSRISMVAAAALLCSALLFDENSCTFFDIVGFRPQTEADSALLKSV